MAVDGGRGRRLGCAGQVVDQLDALAVEQQPNFGEGLGRLLDVDHRVDVTAAMMSIAGAPIPPEVVVPHVMRQVTAADCNPDRVHEAVSGTSLVPDDVLTLMFPAS